MWRLPREQESTTSIMNLGEEEMEMVGAHDQNAEKETFLCCLKTEPFRLNRVGKLSKTWRR